MLTREENPDTEMGEGFAESGDEDLEAAPDAFDEAVDAYDFPAPPPPSYRYSIEQLMYYRDSPLNTPLEQIQFAPDAPLG